jgi:hypothetical protein
VRTTYSEAVGKDHMSDPGHHIFERHTAVCGSDCLLHDRDVSSRLVDHTDVLQRVPNKLCQKKSENQI